MHGKYNGRPPYLNDIALVRMARPAQLHANVRLACLPLDPDEAALKLGVLDIATDLVDKTKARITGWGMTEFDDFIGDFFVSESTVARQGIYNITSSCRVHVLCTCEPVLQYGQCNPQNWGWLH